MKIMVLFVFCIYLMGCAMNPKDPDEFKALVIKYPSWCKINKVSVNKPIETVIKSLNSGVNNCLNFSVSSTRGAINIHAQQTARIEKINSSLYQLTTNYKPLNGSVPCCSPPEGAYYVVTDIKSTSANTTQLTNYYMNSQEKENNFITETAKGSNPKCPY